jgi:hypothetical protein
MLAYSERVLKVLKMGFVLVAGLFILAAKNAPAVSPLEGRVVAIGIPGAGAISAVGLFHPGGPIHDKPEWQAFTNPNSVLDPRRILVASSSNFGAALGEARDAAGSVLSIDPEGREVIQVPESFAAAGEQASAAGGRVMIFSANSPAFLNGVNNPEAVTAKIPAVGGPTGISLNNAFGRIWITNMPAGSQAAGTHTILDANGRPLAGAPSKTAGGVFTGALTNREPQLIPGSMTVGSVATALLGRSPDGSGRAVFAGLNADGSVVQLHVEKGVDGLAPTGTISPLRSGRSGMAFNWVPNRILYVTDPAANSIVALTLRPDEAVFRVESTNRIAARELNEPVDLAPAVMEVASPAFSSNTTLAGESDLYVANRGNGTIVRIKQNGQVVAVRKVVLPGIGSVGRGHLNGIAVSPDASRIWVTVNGSLPGLRNGALIELPAFGGPGSPTSTTR